MVEDLDYLVLHQFDLSFIHYTHPVHQAQLVHNLKHKMSNLLQVGQLLLQLVQLLLHVDQLLLQVGQLLLHIGHSVTNKKQPIQSLVHFYVNCSDWVCFQKNQNWILNTESVISR